MVDRLDCVLLVDCKRTLLISKACTLLSSSESKYGSVVCGLEFFRLCPGGTNRLEFARRGEGVVVAERG